MIQREADDALVLVHPSVGAGEGVLFGVKFGERGRALLVAADAVAERLRTVPHIYKPHRAEQQQRAQRDADDGHAATAGAGVVAIVIHGG